MRRAANNTGSIYKRKDGTWEGKYTAYDNGAPRRHSVYGKTQAECKRRLVEAIASIDRSEYIKPDMITVGQWFDLWLENYVVDVKDSTVNQYAYQGRIHVKPVLGKIRLQSLTGPMVQKFYNDSRKPHTVKIDGKTLQCKGLSAKSVKNLHGVLHRCFSQAIKCGYIRHNPCDACTLPTVKKKEMKTITNVGGFLDAIKGDEYENLYIVDIFSGMRQGEIIGLTWDCVDFENETIIVKQQLRRDHSTAGTEYKFTDTKNGKKRIISLAPFVFEALKRERRLQNTNRLKQGQAFENPYNLVFTDPVGGFLKAGTVYNHLKRILKGMGLGDIRFHDLRHTFATISIENGDDIKTVSESLGHATTAFTMDVYGHVTDAMRKRSGEKMQIFIDSLKKVE